MDRGEDLSCLARKKNYNLEYSIADPICLASRIRFVVSVSLDILHNERRSSD